MKIVFSDLGAQHADIRNEIDQAMSRVVDKGDFILGKDVVEFEKEFAGFCHTRYAVGVASGTAALFLALESLGIGEGDEVIVPAFTFIATALAVSYTGAKPVFVDIEEDTYNLDPKKIQKAVTKNTKAIIPVHLYGQPANMPEILKIAKDCNLKVVEDAAQAHGATLKVNDAWQVTGCIGDIGCFSFYPSKNLGGLGDGGIITTNDEKIYQRLFMLRDYGRVSKYEHAIIGYNLRLDTLQAAVLRVKLKKLDAWNAMRVKAAKVYDRLFNEVGSVVIPYVWPLARHVYHVYAIRTPKRDNVFTQLNDKGVGAIIHYPIPLPLQKAYQELGHHVGDFPVAEKISREIISLPMHPYLTEEQIEFVVNTVKEVLDA